MLHYYIMCRSLTYAQRAARILERYGITAIVTRAPKNVVNEGCTYCVRVSEKKLTPSLHALKNAGLGPGRVFLQSPDGSFREVAG